MKTRIIKSTIKFLAITLILFFTIQVKAATITSASTGNWSSATTWAISLTRPGTVTATVGSTSVTGSSTTFTTTLSIGSQILNTSNVVIGTVASIQSNTALTLVAGATNAMTNSGWNSRGVGSGDAVTISVGHTITVDANYSCASLTFAIATSSNSLTLGNTNTLTVTGIVIMSTPSVNMSSVMNINNGTLKCGGLTTNGTIATRVTNINIIDGLLDINGNYSSSAVVGTTISITGTGGINFGGVVSTAFTLVPGTSSTIKYDMNGVQTCRPVTYNNLTLGGTGVKTITSCIVNNILQFDSISTINAAITYGTNAGLIYNTKIARTASNNEWPTAFTALGGVQIKNTGPITLNVAKTMSSGVSLTINNNATLNTNSFQITFNGNFINNGTLNAGSSVISITGTATSQDIDKFTTSGSVNFNKTSGNASFTGNVSGGALTINSTSGTLNLGSGTHLFSSLNLTLGTVDGGTSTTSFTSNVSKTNGSFLPSTSTINCNGAGQTIAIGNFYNLTLSGTGTKTLPATTVSSNMVVKGYAIFTCAASLSVSGNLSIEENSTFTATGFDFFITGNLSVGNSQSNLSILNISSSSGIKSIGGNFTIKNGATYSNTGNSNIHIAGDLVDSGTTTYGTGIYTLSGNLKSLIYKNPITIPNLNITGYYYNTGILSITNSLTGTGTLENNANKQINLTTNTITISNLIASATGNIINYNLSGNQTIFNTNYRNLYLDGTGIKTIPSSTIQILETFYISGNASTSDITFIVSKDIVVNNGALLNVIGTLQISGNFLITSGGGINWKNGSNLNFNGTYQSYLDANTTKYDMSTITCQGNGIKTVNAANIQSNIFIGNNDTLNLTSSTLTVLGGIIIGDVFSSNSGQLTIGNVLGPKTFSSNVFINNGATFNNLLGAEINFGGNFTNNGTFIPGNSTIAFSGANKTLSGNSISNFYNLRIDSIVTNSSKISIDGLLSGSGKLINSNELYLYSASTISDLDAYSNLNLVVYNGLDPQLILGINYYNLILSGSGVKTLSTSTNLIKGDFQIIDDIIVNSVTNLTINGNLYVDGTATFNCSSFTHTIGGNIDNGLNSTLNLTNASILLNSSSAQNLTNLATDFIIKNIELSGGIKTISTNTYINSTFIINSGSTLQIGNSTTLHLNCTISGQGMISGENCSSTNNTIISCEKTGSNIGTIYIDPVNNNFKKIILLNNCSVTIDSDIGIYDNLDLSSGILSISKKIDFSSSSTPITKTSGFINMSSSSTLSFGECNNTGSNFTLPSSLFTSTPVISNLALNRVSGISLGTNPVIVTGVITITSGNLTSNGMLTLRSDVNGSCRIAPISSSSYTIVGNVTVERFIPGGTNKRKWRLMSSPINVSKTTAFSQLIDDIFVTAPAGAAAGFDVNPLNPANSASLRTYNESTSGASNNGWTDPSSINSTIGAGLGFEVFVRGSRNLANPYLNWTTPDDVTIDYIGSINSGSNALSLSYTNTGNSSADGFNLIGNPYASPINFDTTGWFKTNIQNKFWSYNPNTGAYGVYDADIQNGTNSITKYIASGQGFFVKAFAASPSITFAENTKCINSGNNYFKPASTTQNLFSILKIGISNDSSYTDETMLVFDENASPNGEDEHDASKWFSDALNIYTLSKDNINLNIDARNYPSSTDTIPLAVYSYNGSELMTTHHQLIFSGIESIPSSTQLILWDKYLNTYTNCKENSHYDFNITTDNNSYGKNRFKILVQNKSNANEIEKGKKKISVYPNPSSNQLNIYNPELTPLTYYLTDQLGNTIIIGTVLKESTETIDISNLTNGHYILRCIEENSISNLPLIIIK